MDVRRGVRPALPPDEARIVTALSAQFGAAGKELYLVGGVVRDILLGTPNRGELDFTTNALPEETERLGVNAGASAVYLVGARFGTVGMVFDGPDPDLPISVEITTYRAEHYPDQSRKPSVEFGASLVDDLVIVSGLAYGIDVCAHRQALESGIRTIAVLGHGLATIYPRVHRETAKKIGKQGCLLTDFHSPMGPERNNFLRRNRIIAGISQSTLVVESGASGGALTTANMAVSYNRDLFAIPGRTDDPRSDGCNHLIRVNLAHLTQSPEDMAWMLGWKTDPAREKEMYQFRIFPADDERKILQQIKENPDSEPGVISRRTGIPIQNVLSALLEMELKQWVSLLPGNTYRIKGDVA